MTTFELVMFAVFLTACIVVVVREVRAERRWRREERLRAEKRARELAVGDLKRFYEGEGR